MATNKFPAVPFAGDHMPDPTLSRFLSELMPVASSGIEKEEIVKYFIDVVRSSFGVDRARINEVTRDESQSSINGYILSTKKPYIDNQLSEYSSFPELVGYKNEGYRSYAVLPIMADGKVVSLLEMLSVSENKFSQELVGGVSLGALLVGFALAYKSESGRSGRLAAYFDAVFNGANPQMLVSQNGSIAKANKSAIREFGLSAQGATIERALGAGFAALSQAASHTASASQQIGFAGKTYSVFASRVNDNLLYVSAVDVSEVAGLRSAMQSVSASSGVVLIFTDKDLNIIGATDNFDRMLGYQKGIMIGKCIAELVRGDRERLPSELRAAAEAQPHERSLDLLKVGGYPMRAHMSAAKSLTGYTFMFSNADAEKYVEDLRSGLEDFISNTSDIVITIDGLGYIKSTNMSTESILGYTRDELSGKEAKSIYDDPSVLDRDLAYAKNGGKPDNSYVDMIRKDGQKVPGTHSVRMLTDPEGNPSYVIGIKELLTKRMLDDQELQIRERDKTIKKLRGTGDLKSMFIYNISHELKTPLTNIKGFAKLLYGGDFGELNAEQKEYINTISEEADRLMRIIQQVLDAAKLDANKVKLELSEVDIGALRDNPSIRALEDSARSKGLAFLWKPDYDVPKVIADPNRLMQVFVNLIGNAIKFTDTGGIEVRISRKNKRKIQCDVTDTGIGIRDEDKKDIFRKFYQAQKSAAGGLVKRDGSGTGLGLSITKDIVRLHGGEMFLDSQFGKGSKFSFTLPVNPRSRQRHQQRR